MKTVKNFYFWAEKIWFKLPQKIRFILVGGFNTVFAYCLLNVINLCLLACGFAESKSANIALVCQYVISVNVSFMTMRYYVFQSHGIWQKEYIRALSVYLLTYIINMPMINGLMVFFDMPLWQAQAIYLVFETIFVFVLHKYYSFRKQ